MPLWLVQEFERLWILSQTMHYPFKIGVLQPNDATPADDTKLVGYCDSHMYLSGLSKSNQFPRSFTRGCLTKEVASGAKEFMVRW